GHGPRRPTRRAAPRGLGTPLRRLRRVLQGGADAGDARAGLELGPRPGARGRSAGGRSSGGRPRRGARPLPRLRPAALGFHRRLPRRPVRGPRLPRRARGGRADRADRRHRPRARLERGALDHGGRQLPRPRRLRPAGAADHVDHLRHQARL
ncbi:MAG: Acetyltransferase, partial [uncultured Gemmatimonadaceae bacterium]